MKRFSKTNIYAARLVWDPVVHQNLYNENCYFFLLRMRNPDKHLKATLQSLLDGAQVVSTCIYILYGYYDVLIRMWAASQKRDRFVRLLDEEAKSIEVVHEFKASDINYLWRKKGVKADGVLRYKPQIEKLWSCESNGEQPDDALLEQLKDAGVVHEIPASEDSRIKFYLALSKVPGTLDNKREGQRLREALTSKTIPVDDISIYTGIGFCKYLIKAMAPNYPAIIKYTMEILDSISDLDLRSMTLLIANNDAPESDQIDPRWQEFTTSLLDLETVLGHNYASAIARLTQGERVQMGELFDEFFDKFRDKPFEPVFRSIFLSRLQGNYVPLVEKLAFIMRMEALVRRSLIELFVQTFGKDEWFKTVGEAGKICNIKESPDKYALAQHIIVVGKLVADGQIPRESVEAVLGAELGKPILKLNDLRNAVAHGDIFDEPKAKQKWWGAGFYEVARDICNAGDIYNRLVTKYSSE